MTKREPNIESESIVIESSLELFYLSESNELLFTIKHNQKPALTASLNLDTVLAIIKRHLFEGSKGEFTFQEYDSNQEREGSFISEQVIKAEEVIRSGLINSTSAES